MGKNKRKTRQRGLTVPSKDTSPTTHLPLGPLLKLPAPLSHSRKGTKPLKRGPLRDIKDPKDSKTIEN